MKNQILLASILFIALLGIWLLFFILFRIYKTVTKNNPINRLYLVAGFLVTAWIFPAGLMNFFTMLSDFFLQVYILFAREVSETEIQSPKLIGTVFYSRLWYNSLLFVTGFLTASFTIAGVAALFKKEGEFPGEEFFTNHRSLVKNIIASLVLVLALYFSLSAIIAVPVVNTRSETRTNYAADLGEELSLYHTSDSTMRVGYYDFIERKLFLLEQDTALRKVIPLSLVDLFRNFKTEVNMAFGDLELLRARAVARMMMTDNAGITQRLKVKDKSELSGWYLENRSSYISFLNSKKNLMDIMTNMMIMLREDLLKGNDIYNYASVQQSLGAIGKMEIPKATDLPVRPTLGSDLGVFTLFSGWLLSAESYPLVVIIGLVGFGLLGAATTTFIREKGKGKQKVMLEDLAGVMIKGFTAAIVIFLGVQGSLAILSTGDGNMNAYALFFVVFVAAVFSDDAWEWARNRFDKDFNTKPKT